MVDTKLIEVLLVEDDPVDQMAFKRVVKEQGLPYQYTLTGSISQAHEVLNNKKFDIVICDLSLEDGTLFDILDKIVDKDIPIIVTTGNGDEETAVKAIKGGADDYIIKDVERNYLKILATTVNKALKNKKLVFEHRSAEKALQVSEELYRTLVETSPNGIGMTDLNGKIIISNQQMGQLLGYDHIGDLIGMLSIDFIAPHDQEAYQEMKPALLEGRNQQNEFVLIRKDGSHFLAELNVTLVRDEANLPRGFMMVIVDITDRFKDIFNTVATAMIVVEEDNTISQVNVEFERMSGYLKEDIEGKKRWTDFFLADNLDQMKQYHEIRKINEKAAPRNYESCFVGQDGKISNVLMTVSMTPQTRKSIVALLDITGRKQAEEELHASKERYRNLVENINDCLWETDQDLVITYVSPKIHELLGYRPEEIIKKNPYDLMNPQSLARLKNVWGSELGSSKNPILFEEKLTHKQGHSVIGKISVSRILNPEGIFAGYRGIFHNITEEVRLREERQRLQEQSARMSKLMSISAMSAGIVHEIGQPLNAIRVLVDGMLYWHKKGVQTEQDKIYINMERISKQVGRIDDIIRHMRSFASVGSPTELDLCNLNDTVNRVLDMLGSQLSAHGITITRRLKKDLKSIWGNSISLEEMLINLIVNAMNALDTCEIKEKKISLVTQMIDEWAVIELSDNASGIAENLHSMIFEPFYTSHQDSGGTGLGLPIVRSIVETHKGQITVFNNEDGGATFRIKIPINDQK
ncbi:MAG: PAS domain S-box protein [Syntrophomonas sp.]|nr:PAS domain S-box protein [Syntrophomonas sp.]